MTTGTTSIESSTYLQVQRAKADDPSAPPTDRPVVGVWGVPESVKSGGLVTFEFRRSDIITSACAVLATVSDPEDGIAGDPEPFAVNFDPGDVTRQYQYASQSFTSGANRNVTLTLSEPVGCLLDQSATVGQVLVTPDDSVLLPDQNKPYLGLMKGHPINSDFQLPVRVGKSPGYSQTGRTAFRIRVERSGSISSVQVSNNYNTSAATALGDGGRIRFDFYRDDGSSNHWPTVTRVGQSQGYVPQTAGQFPTVQITPALTVTAGEILHCVAVQEHATNYGSIDGMAVANRGTNMWGPYHGFDFAVFQETSANVWVNAGGKADGSMNLRPSFVRPYLILGYSDGVKIGTGGFTRSSVNNHPVINGQRMVRQRFTIVDGPWSCTGLWFRVCRKASPTGTGALTMRVLASNGTTVLLTRTYPATDFVVTTAIDRWPQYSDADLPAPSIPWKYDAFPAALDLANGTYYIRFSAPAGTEYQMSADVDHTGTTGLVDRNCWTAGQAEGTVDGGTTWLAGGLPAMGMETAGGVLELPTAFTLRGGPTDYSAYFIGNMDSMGNWGSAKYSLPADPVAVIASYTGPTYYCAGNATGGPSQNRNTPGGLQQTLQNVDDLSVIVCRGDSGQYAGFTATPKAGQTGRVRIVSEVLAMQSVDFSSLDGLPVGLGTNPATVNGLIVLNNFRNAFVDGFRTLAGSPGRFRFSGANDATARSWYVRCLHENVTGVLGDSFGVHFAGVQRFVHWQNYHFCNTKSGASFVTDHHLFVDNAVPEIYSVENVNRGGAQQGLVFSRNISGIHVYGNVLDCSIVVTGSSGGVLILLGQMPDTDTEDRTCLAARVAFNKLRRGLANSMIAVSNIVEAMIDQNEFTHTGVGNATRVVDFDLRGAPGGAYSGTVRRPNHPKTWTFRDNVINGTAAQWTWNRGRSYVGAGAADGLTDVVAVNNSVPSGGIVCVQIPAGGHTAQSQPDFDATADLNLAFGANPGLNLPVAVTPPVYSIVAVDPTITAAENAEWDITRDKADTAAATITWTITDPSDATDATGGTANFAAADLTQRITISTRTFTTGADRVITNTISNPSNGGTIGSPSATVTVARQSAGIHGARIWHTGPGYFQASYAQWPNACGAIAAFTEQAKRRGSADQSWALITGGVGTQAIENLSILNNSQPDVEGAAFGTQLNAAPRTGCYCCAVITVWPQVDPNVPIVSPYGRSYDMEEGRTTTTNPPGGKGNERIYDEVLAGTINSNQWRDTYIKFGMRWRLVMANFNHDPEMLVLRANHECNDSNYYQVYPETAIRYKETMERIYAWMKIGYAQYGVFIGDAAPGPNLLMCHPPGRERLTGVSYQEWVPNNTDFLAVSMHASQVETTQAKVDQFIMRRDSGSYGLVLDVEPAAAALNKRICIPEWAPRFELNRACPVSHLVMRQQNKHFRRLAKAGILAFETVFDQTILQPTAYRETDAAGIANWKTMVSELPTLWRGTPKGTPLFLDGDDYTEDLRTATSVDSDPIAHCTGTSAPRIKRLITLGANTDGLKLTIVGTGAGQRVRIEKTTANNGTRLVIVEMMLSATDYFLFDINITVRV